MAATSYYNAKTGTGWRKIQTGPNKGKYQAYKNFKPTNRIKSNLTLGSGAAKFISKNVKKAQSKIAANSEANKKSMIGKGTAKNPEFITNKRGRKVKNPGFKPPTMVATEEKSNDKPSNKNNNKENPWSVANVRRKSGGEVGTSNADARGTISWTKNNKDKPPVKPGNPKETNVAPKKDVDDGSTSDSAGRAWQKKTANSPASKAFTNEERWKIQKGVRERKAAREKAKADARRKKQIADANKNKKKKEDETGSIFVRSKIA